MALSPEERRLLSNVRGIVERLMLEFDDDGVEHDPMELDLERVARNVRDLDAALALFEVEVKAST